MAERGVVVAHTTIMRWIQRYVPEFEKRWSRFAREAGGSWRVHETYVKIKGRWTYLYRAVDKAGKRSISCSAPSEMSPPPKRFSVARSRPKVSYRRRSRSMAIKLRTERRVNSSRNTKAARGLKFGRGNI